jgi:hypothetical protein
MMIGAVLVVAWMLNDVFAKGKEKKIAAGGRNVIVDLATLIFLEAFEMGDVARRFPRATFAIGADAATWSVGPTFNFYALRLELE